MLARHVSIGLLLATALALGACAARPNAAVQSPDPRDILHARVVNPSLVTHGGELIELAMRRDAVADERRAGWELSRNDGRVLALDTQPYAPWVFLEVRHSEHLRTSNGRPREFTSTITRSIRREFRR